MSLLEGEEFEWSIIVSHSVQCSSRPVFVQRCLSDCLILCAVFVSCIVHADFH